jgi:hypothetical protein
LEKTLATAYEKDIWLAKRDTYVKRMREIAVVTGNDPQKLKAIKEGLERNAEKYFTCLTKPGIPADNNKAERGLRHSRIQTDACGLIRASEHLRNMRLNMRLT